jgi:universal stress protein A
LKEVVMSDNPYRHLLLAVDFAPESEVVVQRAVAMRERFGARLTLLNVVEYVPPETELAGGAFMAEPMLPSDLDLERELVDVARQELDALGARIGVPPEDRIVEFGPTGRSIEHVAKDLAVDLIIVGARDHTWLGNLFGSISRSLLRHEVCDLLAVRIAEKEQQD